MNQNNVIPSKPEAGSIVGLAIESLAGSTIVHGLRHPEKDNSNGWYIWAGEYSEDENFFSPVCFEHLEQYLDQIIIKNLDLPPGYRFIIDPGKHKDIWFDDTLLEID